MADGITRRPAEENNNHGIAMPLSSIDAVLDSLLERHQASLAAGQGLDPLREPDGFIVAFATLGWRLRRTPLALQETERATLCAAGLATPGRLSVADLARARLLRQALRSLPAEGRADWLQELFRSGDNAEREAVLKVLLLLPEPQSYLETALDACRSAVHTTVAAITCGNAYPARYFPPDAFRGMVLKALHLGLPLAEIQGLAERRDGELARMAADYASELRAAGRPVPADIVLLDL